MSYNQQTTDYSGYYAAYGQPSTNTSTTNQFPQGNPYSQTAYNPSYQNYNQTAYPGQPSTTPAAPYGTYPQSQQSAAPYNPPQYQNYPSTTNSNQWAAYSNGYSNYGYNQYNGTQWVGTQATTKKRKNKEVKQPPPPPLGKFFCDVCDVHCNDEHAYMLHLNGKKHVSQLRKMGKLPPSQASPPSADTSTDSTTAVPATETQITSKAKKAKGKKGEEEDEEDENNKNQVLLTEEDKLVNHKHSELTPMGSHQVALASLIQTVVTSINNIKEKGINSVHIVGSYTKGTMLRGDTTGDVTVIFTERPTTLVRDSLADHLRADPSITENNSTNPNVTVTINGSHISLLDCNNIQVLVLLTWVNAFSNIVSIVENGTDQPPEEQPVTENEVTEAAVKVNETTETETKTYDPNTEINIKDLQLALSAVHHATYFSHKNVTANERACVRVLKWYKKHHPIWQVLNTWAIEVLIDKTLSLTGTATIARSIRSVFEFVSAGALLPGGFGLPDPCTVSDEVEPMNDPTKDLNTFQMKDLAIHLNDEQRDEITKDAQETLRHIAFGRWDAIFSSTP